MHAYRDSCMARNGVWFQGWGPRRRLPELAAAILVAFSLGACARGPQTQAYVERLGADTTLVEVFRITKDRIEGHLLVRSPATQIAHYVGHRSPEGRITRFDIEWETPATNPEGPPPRGSVTTVWQDSAVTVIRNDAKIDTVTARVTPQTIPAISRIPFTLGVLQLAVSSARASGESEYRMSFLFPGSAEPWENAIVTRAPDTLSLDFFGSPFLIRVDAGGRLLSITGRETTMKLEVERVGDVDVQRLAAEFAARDARGEGLGPVSPAATVTFRVSDASLEIRYGRPSKRGRTIFGHLVPWNEVWRTGANAATHFQTNRALVIGDTEIPAGTYTLWSTFTPTTATLIINSQTRQWGTQYDESQDFVRVPMQRSTLPEPLETFTIGVVESEAGAALRLEWDTSRFSVPVRLATEAP